MKKILKYLLDKGGYRMNSTKFMVRQFLNNDHILTLDFDHVLCKYLQNTKDPNEFSFIQIGAFDGIECDPLRKYLLKYKWSGVMMEPQPIPYAKLRKEYADRAELKIVNAALSEKPGKSSLYILEGDTIPEWAKGMASFDKENILKHQDLIPNLNTYIKNIEIQVLSFKDIFETYKIGKLDLLQTDTEGFDAEIISMFPFEITKPSIIHFESKHIKKNRLEQLLDLLIKQGYYIAYDRGEDMVAVLMDK